MRRDRRQTGARAAAIGFALLALTTMPATAQKKTSETPAPAAPVAAEKPTPYDPQLIEIAEVLGSLHYLRNLCDNGGEPQWRATMQQLLDAETTNEPQRKARMTAAFNKGYRGFAAIHTTCTPAALEAESKYRAEGATLAREITARYGN